MKTYISETIEIKHIPQDKYEMLIDLLEDNNINYDEVEYEEYTLDERSEDEKYDDWLCEQADIKHDEEMLGE